jgi:hypothetical protein
MPAAHAFVVMPPAISGERLMGYLIFDPVANLG